MQSTIYARVDPDLKEATDNYAAEHGMSLASAVADLLTRGLEAASNEASLHALDARAHELAVELSRLRDTAATMEERLKQVLGRCHCGNSLTGRDLLVTGRCSRCSTSVAGLLGGSDDPRGGSLNRNE